MRVKQKMFLDSANKQDGLWHVSCEEVASWNAHVSARLRTRAHSLALASCARGPANVCLRVAQAEEPEPEPELLAPLEVRASALCEGSRGKGRCTPALLPG